MIRLTNLVEYNVILESCNYFADVTHETPIDREGSVREFVDEALDSIED